MPWQYSLHKVMNEPCIYCLKLPGEEGAHENCYVLLSEGEMLILDPPIYKPKNIEAFHRAICQLDEDIRRISVCLTHIHGELSRMDPTILKDADQVFFMEEEYQDYISHNNRNYKISRFRREGFPEEEIKKVFPVKKKQQIPVRREFIFLKDRNRIPFAGYDLRCIHTPGPTKGHICFYLTDYKILFSGALLPQEGYPSSDVWKGRANALEHMIDSLEMLKKIETEQILPGIGAPFSDVCSRVEDIVSYYSMRLLQLYQLVRDHPGENAYELALRIGYPRVNAERISAKNRWRLMKETLACLVQLRLNKYVSTQRNEICVRNYPGSTTLSDNIISNL